MVSDKMHLQRETMLGRFNDTGSIPDQVYGVCEVTGRGWYAVMWGDSIGPFADRKDAQDYLSGVETYPHDPYNGQRPGMCENYRQLAWFAAKMLTGATIMLLTGWAFVWLVWAALDN